MKLLSSLFFLLMLGGHLSLQAGSVAPILYFRIARVLGVRAGHVALGHPLYGYCQCDAVCMKKVKAPQNSMPFLDSMDISEDCRCWEMFEVMVNFCCGDFSATQRNELIMHKALFLKQHPRLYSLFAERVIQLTLQENPEFLKALEEVITA